MFSRILPVAIVALAWWLAIDPLRKGYVFYTSMKGSRVDRKNDPLLYWPMTLAGIVFAVFLTWKVVADGWLR
jgi:hypothetical protein